MILETALCPENYKKKFNILYHAEEHQLQFDITAFDMAVRKF